MYVKMYYPLTLAFGLWKKNEVCIYTLPHLKCIRLVSVRLSLPCINIDERIELKKNVSGHNFIFLMQEEND